jgi:hypothetical protein
MKSHDVIKQAIDDKGAKQVAVDVGVSLSMLYKWSQPQDESGARNPLDRTLLLLRSTGSNGPLQWLCQQQDGVFVKNPPPAESDLNVLAETQRILKEFSDLLHVVTTAWADHRVSPSEAQAIRREWDELKSVAEGFVRACERSAPPDR